MKNIQILTYNVYATNDDGRNFRAVSVAGCWRLAVEVTPGCRWDFVNNTEYASGLTAIMDCDLY